MFRVRFGERFLVTTNGPSACGKSSFLCDIKKAVISLDLPYTIKQVGDNTLEVRRINLIPNKPEQEGDE